MQREKVYIIYQNIPGLIKGTIDKRIVKGIVYTPEQAQIFANKLAKELDLMYGIDIQEWEMDTDRPNIWKNKW